MKHLLTQIWCTRVSRMKQKSYDFYEAKRTLTSPCGEATLHRRSLLHFSCTVRCASLKKFTAKRWIFLAEGVGFEPTCLSANGFQDRLVMTTSISLRKYDATACIIFTEFLRCGSANSVRQIRFAFAQRIFAVGEISRIDAYCTFFVL